MDNNLLTPNGDPDPMTTATATVAAPPSAARGNDRYFPPASGEVMAERVPAGQEPAVGQTQSLLTREHILARASATIASEIIDVPEWGGQVVLREMTKGQRDRMQANQVRLMRDGTQLVTVQVERLRHYLPCIYDVEGRRIFKDADAEALNNMGFHVMERIVDKIDKLSEYTPDKTAEDQAAMANPTSSASTT